MNRYVKYFSADTLDAWSFCQRATRLLAVIVSVTRKNTDEGVMYRVEYENTVEL